MRKALFLLVGLLLVLLIVFSESILSKPQPPTEFISITLYNTPINFETMDPGQTQLAVNNPLIISVDSNVNFDIEVAADANDFESSKDSFPVSNMQWNIINSFPGTAYVKANTLIYSSQSAGNYTMYHQLTTPPAQPAGAYSVGITITASGTKK